MDPQALQAAREILLAVAAGEPPALPVISTLVQAVLADDLVQLALAVQRGGEHALSRAVQLAAAVSVHAQRAARSPPSEPPAANPTNTPKGETK